MLTLSNLIALLIRIRNENTNDVVRKIVQKSFLMTLEIAALTAVSKKHVSTKHNHFLGYNIL